MVVNMFVDRHLNLQQQLYMLYLYTVCQLELVHLGEYSYYLISMQPTSSLQIAHFRAQKIRG